MVLWHQGFVLSPSRYRNFLRFLPIHPIQLRLHHLSPPLKVAPRQFRRRLQQEVRHARHVAPLWCRHARQLRPRVGALERAGRGRLPLVQAAGDAGASVAPDLVDGGLLVLIEEEGEDGVGGVVGGS